MDQDPDIFKGDASIDTQYDIYRHMKNIVQSGENKTPGWEGYHPETNMLWLKFLAGKTLIQTEERKKTTKTKKKIQTLEKMLKKIENKNTINIGLFDDI